MKRFFYLLAILGVVMIGCKKDKAEPKETLQFVEDITQPIHVECTEGSLVLSFEAYNEWVASVNNSDAAWLTVSPTSGSKGGRKLLIEYTANTQTVERKGNIIVSSVKNTYIITIIQAKNETAQTLRAFTFAENSNKLNVGYDAGTQTFNFTANVENWAAKSSVDWLTIDPTSGKKGDQKMTITFGKNDDKTNTREGKITVSSGDSSFVITVNQTQNSEGYFEFDKNTEFSKNVDYTAGNLKFTFKSKVANWSATSSDGWLTVSPASGGNGDQELTIAFERNEDKTNAREGVITVSSDDVSFKITVTQGKNTEPYFIFASGVQFSKNVAYTEGTESFSFKSNVEGWIATSSVDWLTVTPTSGNKGDQTLTINFVKSEQRTEREGTITVSKDDSSFVIKVKQAKNTEPYFTFATGISFAKNVAYTEGTETFSFHSNVEGWSATSSIEWLTVTPTSGDKGDYTLTLNYTKNETAAERNGTITVHKGDSSFVITVKQAQDIFNIFTFMDDAEFKTYCEQFDTNNDGILSLTEANDIKTISVNGNSITNKGPIKSLKGIEYFANLTSLSCAFNQISMIDISKNTKLTTLNCGYNELSLLDVTKNTALKILMCHGNQLISLDLSKNTALTSLYCSPMNDSNGNNLLQTIYLKNEEQKEQIQTLSKPSNTKILYK